MIIKELIKLASELDDVDQHDIADNMDDVIDIMIDEGHYAIDDDTPRQCAWCLAIYDENTDDWVPHPEKINKATHGLCPKCTMKMLDEEELPKKTARQTHPNMKSTAIHPFNSDVHINDWNA